MNLTITIASAKPGRVHSSAEVAAERKRLTDMGFEVYRHRERICASRQIHDFAELQEIWDSNFFHIVGEDPRPGMISIVFHDVTCATVNNFISGWLNLVVMTNPHDPHHCATFRFSLGLDGLRLANARNIEVRRERVQGQGNEMEQFLHVLRVCCKYFYRRDANVQFNSRKSIGRAIRSFAERGNNQPMQQVLRVEMKHREILSK